MRIAGTLLLTAVALLVIAIPGWTVTRPDQHASPDAEVLVPYYDVGGTLENYLLAGNRSSAESQSIRQRLGGGQWQYSWNGLTGTLFDAYGDALRVHDGWLTSREQVDRVARDFITENFDLLGARAEQVVLDMIVQANRKWYVHYRQVMNGVPVHGAKIKLQLTEDGRLIRFGSGFHPYASVSEMTLSTAAASDIATSGLSFNPATDSIEDRGLVIVPVPAAGNDETAVEYHLAHNLTVATHDPVGRWVTFVDASNGDIVRRHNDVHFVELTGSVTGEVDEETYCLPPPIDTGMEDLRIEVDGVGYTYTDESGNFAIDVPDGLPKPVEFKLKGLHCRTDNQAEGEPDAVINTTGTPGVPLDVYWDDANSTAAERDCFYHQNRIYDHIKSIVGSLSMGSLDGQFPCNVNIASTCNAFFNGSSINFYQAGGGCGNTGEISDVIYHEYGHGIDYYLSGFDIGQMGEGFADIFMTMANDQPRVGRGFYAASCNLVLRNCNNTMQYPQHITGDPYNDGQIICAFNWDVYQNFQTSGTPDSRRDSLMTFTVISEPANHPQFVTQWFIEDDDDGVLNNGTPNYDDLCDAAQQHGYACPEIFEGVIINHSPYEDTSNTVDPYELIAVIGTTDVGGMDSTYVFYSIDLGAFTPLAMTPTGNPSEYRTEIPAQSEGSLIRYYVLGSDFANHRATSPADAPGIAHSVVVSSVGLPTHEAWDMETEAGWTVGDQSPQLPDDASAGIWERGDPLSVLVWIGGNPVPATPEDDTTPEPGINCWFTEQEVAGHQAGEHDVDGGKTTLRSPVFDISGLDFARLSYQRWFTNGLGNNKSEDPWQVGLSSNGGLTYTTIEETLVSASEWVETKLDLNGYVPFGSNMRMRFVARDNETGNAGPSIVEAAVDDVEIRKWPIGSNAVEEEMAGAVPARFDLGQNNPNPFNPSTSIDFTVAATGPVELRVFNVSGQLVRTLVDATIEAGQYSVSWDGRDVLGAQVASGVYYYRIDAPDFTRTRKMVLLK